MVLVSIHEVMQMMVHLAVEMLANLLSNETQSWQLRCIKSMTIQGVSSIYAAFTENQQAEPKMQDLHSFSSGQYVDVRITWVTHCEKLKTESSFGEITLMSCCGSMANHVTSCPVLYNPAMREYKRSNHCEMNWHSLSHKCTI